MKEDNLTRGTGTDKDIHEVRHRAVGVTTGVTDRLIREAVTIRITIEAITTEEHILLLRTVEDLEVRMGITVLMTVTILGTTAGEVVTLHLTTTTDMVARLSHTQTHPKGKLGTANCPP